jgi:uncharacterized protein
MTVVLDTNIVVSATFFNGKPRRCLEAWEDMKFALIVSPEILTEYEQIIARVAIQLQRPSVDWLSNIRRDAKVVRSAPVRPLCRDSKDEIYIQAAVGGRVDYLVTGDLDLLDLRVAYDIPIVKVDSFLRFIA